MLKRILHPKISFSHLPHIFFHDFYPIPPAPRCSQSTATTWRNAALGEEKTTEGWQADTWTGSQHIRFNTPANYHQQHPY